MANKLIDKNDHSTVAVWAEKRDHDHKLAYLKRHHDVTRDFVLFNNDLGIRYKHNGEEWLEICRAENPTAEPPAVTEEFLAAQAAAKIENDAELARIAADPKNELHEKLGLTVDEPLYTAEAEELDETDVFHAVHMDDTSSVLHAELAPITDLENYKPEPGHMLPGFDDENPKSASTAGETLISAPVDNLGAVSSAVTATD